MNEGGGRTFKIMKYIITENRLHNIIYEYINNLMPKLEIKDDKVESVAKRQTRIVTSFYTPDDNIIPLFIYHPFSKNYDYSPEQKVKLPILFVREIDIFINLNDMFNNEWYEPFEQWFNTNYPQYPVKTFVFQ